MSLTRVIRRIAAALIFIALVSTTALVLARKAPGDYTDTLRAARASEETIARERQRLYLDRSLPDLSRIWLTGLAKLDFGMSYRFERPVRSLLAERAPRTLTLIATSVTLAAALGLLWGTGLVRGHRYARALLSFMASAMLSLPSVVLLFGLLFVVVKWGWLGQGSQTFVIPILGGIALVLPAAAALARLHAEALSQALAEPWAVAASARGLTSSTVVWKLATRVAATRATSVLPLVTANVLGASVLVEVVSGWAGIGRLMLDALVSRDIFLVAGCTAAIAAAVMVFAILSDIAIAVLDPRIEAPGQNGALP